MERVDKLRLDDVQRLGGEGGGGGTCYVERLQPAWGGWCVFFRNARNNQLPPECLQGSYNPGGTGRGYKRREGRDRRGGEAGKAGRQGKGTTRDEGEQRGEDCGKGREKVERLELIRGSTLVPKRTDAPFTHCRPMPGRSGLITA